jgi:hypothetical protein
VGIVPLIIEGLKNIYEILVGGKRRIFAIGGFGQRGIMTWWKKILNGNGFCYIWMSGSVSIK